MKTIALVNKKGGAGKTTTAIGLALGIRKKTGERVGLVDTDPNGSATRWLQAMDDVAGLDTVPCPSGDLAALLPGLESDFDFIIIDSPPNDAGAISHIAKVSNLALLPLAPTPIEVDQLPDTVELLMEAGTQWVVVPVRARMSTTSGKSIRKQCSDLGIPVTTAVVPLTEAIAGSFGMTVPYMPYAHLVSEVLDLLKGAEE
jgi:chromosome partitioning protein